MNYAELSLKERKAKAKEYAALLSSEEQKTSEDVIKEIGEVFGLTSQEAAEVYLEMRDEYKQSFKHSSNFKITKGIISFFICLLIAAFYYFMGQEVGSFLIIIGVAFFAFSIGSVLFVFQNLSERFFPRQVIKKQVQPKKEPPLAYTVLGFTAFILAITLFQYFSKSGYVAATDIRVIEKMTLRGEPISKSTGSKNRRTYYEFRFFESKDEFRYYGTYYKYSDAKFDPSDLKQGDKIDIEIYKSDARSLLDFEEEEIDMVNFFLNGVPHIDHVYRNKQELENNETWLGYAIIAFILSSLIALWWRNSMAKK